MRFTLSSTALSSKLTALSRVINSKNSQQILGDFIFQTSGNVLYLTASDGENTIKTSVELAECDSDGGIAIENHSILEAMKGLAEQPVNFDIDPSGIVKITYQNGQYALPIDDASVFPPIKDIEDGYNEIKILSSQLSDCINRSLFATAQDELRPVMNGVYFDLNETCLTIVASDGHKLVRNRLLNIKSEQPASFILPKKPAGLLKGMLVKDDTEVTIKFDAKHVVISFGDTIMSSRLIDGRYPNYNSVIPTNNPNQVVADREALLSALRRVQPFANDASNLVRFQIDNSTLQLDAEDFDFSKTATERMSCEYDGQPMRIGFKGASFIEVLSNLECDSVQIRLADPSRAGVVLPSEQTEGEEVLMLLMPMLIND